MHHLAIIYMESALIAYAIDISMRVGIYLNRLVHAYEH